MSRGGFNRDKGAAAGGSTVQAIQGRGTHPNNALRGPLPGRVGGCGFAGLHGCVFLCTYTKLNTMKIHTYPLSLVISYSRTYSDVTLELLHAH